MRSAREIGLVLVIIVAAGCSFPSVRWAQIEGVSIPRGAPSDLSYVFTSVRERTPSSSPSRYVPQFNAGEEQKWMKLSPDFWRTALTLYSRSVQTQLRQYAEFYRLTNAAPAFLEQLKYDDDPVRRRMAAETLLIINSQIQLDGVDLQPLYANLSEGGYDVAPEREVLPGRQSDYENWRSARISAALQARLKR